IRSGLGRKPVAPRVVEPGHASPFHTHEARDPGVESAHRECRIRSPDLPDVGFYWTRLFGRNESDFLEAWHAQTCRGCLWGAIEVAASVRPIVPVRRKDSLEPTRVLKRGLVLRPDLLLLKPERHDQAAESRVVVEGLGNARRDPLPVLLIPRPLNLFILPL